MGSRNIGARGCIPGLRGIGSRGSRPPGAASKPSGSTPSRVPRIPPPVQPADRAAVSRGPWPSAALVRARGGFVVARAVSSAPAHERRRRYTRRLSRLLVTGRVRTKAVVPDSAPVQAKGCTGGGASRAGRPRPSTAIRPILPATPPASARTIADEAPRRAASTERTLADRGAQLVPEHRETLAPALEPDAGPSRTRRLPLPPVEPSPRSTPPIDEGARRLHERRRVRADQTSAPGPAPAPHPFQWDPRLRRRAGRTICSGPALGAPVRDYRVEPPRAGPLEPGSGRAPARTASDRFRSRPGPGPRSSSQSMATVDGSGPSPAPRLRRDSTPQGRKPSSTRTSPRTDGRRCRMRRPPPTRTGPR